MKQGPKSLKQGLKTLKQGSKTLKQGPRVPKQGSRAPKQGSRAPKQGPKNMVLLGDGFQGQVFKVSRGANGSPRVQDPFGCTRMPQNPPKPQFLANSRVRARPPGQVPGQGLLGPLWAQYVTACYIAQCHFGQQSAAPSAWEATAGRPQGQATDFG